MPKKKKTPTAEDLNKEYMKRVRARQKANQPGGPGETYSARALAKRRKKARKGRSIPKPIMSPARKKK